ncbi:hypothetical protein AVL61_14300 [Kocuria rosea subsp. polaris]|uniref:Lipoprotein n=1 Tax=Kocuria rosea subsp. polaris TaxID=136273 RepID=A0A0W8IC48_KOCRO|nr:hypothetical protein [Kocuria polaris]KUG57296.1 hypothetical protein AVL61_14300 [Kocuria polaris]
MTRSSPLRPLVPALCAALLLTGCAQGAGPGSAAAPAASASPSSATSSPTPTPTPEEPAELIGGGTEVFPERRMVALYGRPGTPALGVLGEQGPEESAARAKELAAQYEPFSEVPVVPAFEIIATTASAGPGEDGDYSEETSVEELRPYVEAAAEQDVYVVLDLQPGRQDFLSQAQQYQELLELPNVGLALDPEWRLAPGQVHMVQIGSVDAAEINATTAWLADLTREHELPQKVVVLHQFAESMITNRHLVDASRPELALVLHADGHGTPELKKGTWERLQQGLPEGIRMAWKNFYDEDTPTFTPEETSAIEPQPWFVSYQ